MMKNLQKGFDITSKSFELAMTGIPPWIAKENRNDYQAAFIIEHKTQLESMTETIKSGIREFSKIFEKQPTYFVPPNGPFSSKLEHTLSDAGIKFINTPKIYKDQLSPVLSKIKFRFLGYKNKFNQIYITRNAYFEPSKNPKIDWVESCLYDIKTAFQLKKPAVISTHRVNYIGSINSTNRELGLFSLQKLLKEILQKWPNVEFFSTAELGREILKST